MRKSPDRGLAARVQLIESLEPRTLLSAVSITTLKESSTASTFGQPVAFTAVVTSKAAISAALSGSVTFQENGKALATVTLNSAHQAVLNTAALVVGSDKLTAVFNGSTAYAASTSASVAHTVAAAHTKTTLSVSTLAPVLGQSITLTVAVAPIAPGAGIPAGSMKFYDGTTLLGTISLDRTGHASLAVYTLFVGKHSIKAVFAGSSMFTTSTSSTVLATVSLPKGDSLTSKTLEVSTIRAGTGAGAVNGQTLEVNYTGYLVNGTKFDSSLNAGRTPFQFTLGAGTVIEGWEQGMLGLKVGETRVLIVPPSDGYGSAANGSIPANSTLIFIVQLLAFEKPQLLVGGGPASKILTITNKEAASAADGTNFGSVKVGSSSATETFYLAAGNSAPLSFTNNPPLVLSGADAGDFVLTQPTNSSSGQTIFTITFKPKAKGVRTATLTIYTTDAQNPEFIVYLTGTGE